ncbi:MAG TPA: tetratricopeptide repeat protein, partial [Planctomycetaceae bacterium]|nr:tetratricopeptide repeat protein [Planctomycetaceae bacterium]
MNTPRPRVVIGLLALLAGCASPGGLASRPARSTPQMAQSTPEKIEGERKEFRRDPKVAESKGITVGGFQNTPEATDPIADLLEQAKTEERDKHYPEARKLYLSVLERQPNHALANHRLGVLADLDSNFAESERYYKAALRQTPQDPALLSDIGFSYLRQGRLNDSELSLQQALQFDSKHKIARNNLGRLYAQRAKNTDSREDYERAYEQFRLASNEDYAQQQLHQVFPKGPPGGSANIASDNPFAPTETRDNPFAVADASEPPVEAPPPTTRNPARTGAEFAQTGGPGVTRGASPLITPAVRAAYGPDTSTSGSNEEMAVFGQNSSNGGPVITPGRSIARAEPARGVVPANGISATTAQSMADEPAFAGNSGAQTMPQWAGDAPSSSAAPAVTAASWAGGTATPVMANGNDRGFNEVQRQAALLGMQAGMGTMFPLVDAGAGSGFEGQPLPTGAPNTPPA